MKARIKNWATSILGILFIIAALTMLVINRLNLMEATDFGALEMILTAILGWAFLMAKDSLLNGLFLGLFGKLGWIKEDED